MNNNELLICSKSILNFLLNSDEEYRKIKDINNIPSLMSMMKELSVYNLDMVEFTKLVNDKLNIFEKPLWINSPREFFSSKDEAVFFYNMVIKTLGRNEKLEKIKSNINV